MKKYSIPVSWTMTANVTVEADSPEEALKRANEIMYQDVFPLPRKNCYYLEESFNIDAESPDEIEETERLGTNSLSEITIHKDNTWD